MSKIIQAVLIVALIAGLSANALARSTDEAFDAAQPRGHGPQTVAGLTLEQDRTVSQ